MTKGCKKIGFGTLLICAQFIASGPAWSDDPRAQAMFDQAQSLFQALPEDMPAEYRLHYLQQLFERFDTIAELYPDSDLAAAIEAESKIGDLDIAELRAEISQIQSQLGFGAPGTTYSLIDIEGRISRVDDGQSLGREFFDVGKAMGFRFVVSDGGPVAKAGASERDFESIEMISGQVGTYYFAGSAGNFYIGDGASDHIALSGIRADVYQRSFNREPQSDFEITSGALGGVSLAGAQFNSYDISPSGPYGDIVIPGETGVQALERYAKASPQLAGAKLLLSFRPENSDSGPVLVTGTVESISVSHIDGVEFKRIKTEQFDMTSRMIGVMETVREDREARQKAAEAEAAAAAAEAARSDAPSTRNLPDQDPLVERSELAGIWSCTGEGKAELRETTEEWSAEFSIDLSPTGDFSQNIWYQHGPDRAVAKRKGAWNIEGDSLVLRARTTVFDEFVVDGEKIPTFFVNLAGTLGSIVGEGGTDRLQIEKSGLLRSKLALSSGGKMPMTCEAN